MWREKVVNLKIRWFFHFQICYQCLRGQQVAYWLMLVYMGQNYPITPNQCHSIQDSKSCCRLWSRSSSRNASAHGANQMKPSCERNQAAIETGTQSREFCTLFNSWWQFCKHLCGRLGILYCLCTICTHLDAVLDSVLLCSEILRCHWAATDWSNECSTWH